MLREGRQARPAWGNGVTGRAGGVPDFLECTRAAAYHRPHDHQAQDIGPEGRCNGGGGGVR
jgi:hypothetical protein